MHRARRFRSDPTQDVDRVPYARRDITLCLDAQLLDPSPGLKPKRVVAWGLPKIRKTDAEESPVSPEEERPRKEQLRAIGYAQ